MGTKSTVARKLVNLTSQRQTVTLENNQTLTLGPHQQVVFTGVVREKGHLNHLIEQHVLAVEKAI